VPHAKGGLATIENISLRCRRHNQYEAVFGAHGTSEVREAQGLWPAGEGYLPAIATSVTSKRSGVLGGIVGGFPALP
jgi:hypothetical protein